eukprot:s587_g23.t1
MGPSQSQFRELSVRNCSYDYVYGDMLGFARLARASLIVDAMVACPPQRFAKFVASLRFDQLLEFDEGDVGLGGGIQIKEPGNLNPTSDDIIQRYGGTSSPEMQWPEEEKEDRYTRIKNLIMLLKKPPMEGFSSLGTGAFLGGGYAMDLNFALLVLPTLKSLQTTMRRVSSSREWVPIDDPINFHIVIASFTMIASAIHIAGHCVHAYIIRTSPTIQSDPFDLWKLTSEEKASGMTLFHQIFNIQMRCAGFTGVVLTVMMLAILLTALNCSRRRTNCISRRIGGFNLFWRIHMSWKWLYVLLLLHAPARLWIWFFFPAIFVVVDRLLLANHQALYLHLRSVKLLPRDVIGLTFELPQGFAYQAGQYILLGWKGEWHPFTLTSAPEENCISVHIRSPNSLDWCSALRKRLTQDAPAEAAGIDPADSKPPKAPLLIEYSKCVLSNSPIVYNTPRVAARTSDEGTMENEGPRLLGRSTSGKQVEPVQSGETMISRVQPGMLPPEAVVLQVTGPFGAPAQKVWGFETLMVVGAGIGVTPFASILRSVQLRAKQRETIMSTASRPSAWKSAMGQGSEDARAGLQRLVEDLVVVPKKIYFYWICRGQEEFDWFCDLLSDAAEGPAAGIVDITLFLTGEIELSQVKKLPCASGQFFGRPNWGRIFKQNREKHKGEHIGVFLCGSPIIGEALSRESIKNSEIWWELRVARASPSLRSTSDFAPKNSDLSLTRLVCLHHQLGQSGHLHDRCWKGPGTSTAFPVSLSSNPRGSNNKLREQSNNVQNANRLFDSQNNAASGYQIGDDCKPACKDPINIGSELYIEWHHQHGCGVGHPNLKCQIILQYMSESDNVNLRDGTGTLMGGELRCGTDMGQDSAGGDDDDPTEAGTAEPARGYHEPLDFYEACAQRQRNEGLYTADQNLESNGGATSTRQNPNGNGRRRGQQRHGLECPEDGRWRGDAEMGMKATIKPTNHGMIPMIRWGSPESISWNSGYTIKSYEVTLPERDYYPYWHPSVWHDIAILTDEPETRCAYYQMESQNVKAKHICSIPAHNNRDACESNNGEWQEVAPFNEPAPECLGSIQSRDNHNGNVRNGCSAKNWSSKDVGEIL